MIQIREATEKDTNCIYATWLRSYRHGALFPRHIPERVYYAQHHNIIERLLKVSTALIATTDQEPDVILGWAVFQKEIPAIHYVYIKPAFRRMGIATKLVGDLFSAGVNYSHETFALREAGIGQKLLTSFYNPYLALVPSAQEQ